MQPCQRVFQPKHPSLQSQRRMQDKKVFVPANSVNVTDPVWLQNPKKTQTGDHMGWIASKSSLDKQGYSSGQRKLWLSKPQVKAYLLQPKMYYEAKKRKLKNGGKPKRQRTK